MKKKFKNIITNTPYRISLGGGGTDLPFYYKEKGGYLISASIDQYITTHIAERKLDDKIFLQYSETEWADNIDNIKHEIIKLILKYYNMTKGIQVGTYSSMPTYTGLGASSALIVGLVNAFIKLKNQNKTKLEIAEIAYHIERVLLKLEGGFQDQYITSLGGIQVIEIDKEGKVSCKPLKIGPGSLKELQTSLVLVHTKINRRSDDIIKAQYDSNMAMDCYEEIKEIGIESSKYLINGDCEKLGLAMDKHWKIKKKITNVMTNSYLDDVYIELKKSGAFGGKIIGAGGGGFFLMAIPKHKNTFFEKLEQLKLRSVPFKFEFLGTHLLHSQEN